MEQEEDGAITENIFETKKKIKKIEEKYAVWESEKLDEEEDEVKIEYKEEFIIAQEPESVEDINIFEEPDEYVKAAEERPAVAEETGQQEEVILKQLNIYESLIEKDDEPIFDAADEEAESLKKEQLVQQKLEQAKFDKVAQMSVKAGELKAAGNYMLCAQIINKIQQMDITDDQCRDFDFELINCYKNAGNKDLLKKKVYEVLNRKYTCNIQEKNLLKDALNFLK